MLGSSDVDDNLDPNYGYYTLDYVAYDLYERQLYAYPSVMGQTFTIAPDLATQLGVTTSSPSLLASTRSRWRSAT